MKIIADVFSNVLRDVQ